MKDRLRIRDLSTTVSDQDFDLPLTIAIKYRVGGYNYDKTGRVFIFELVEVKDKKGKLTGYKRTLLIELDENMFKKLYNVPQSKNIGDFVKFYLNTNKLPPFFDIIDKNYIKTMATI